MNLDVLFNNITKLKVAVIGDAMLDTYWWGKVDRISPEAPVPVVSVIRKEQRIGGAANVALNVQALGSKVFLLGVIGADAEGNQLTELAHTQNIDTRFIVKSAHRITTNKIRIISRNQHMMRLDAEITQNLTKEEEESLLYNFENFIAEVNPDIVILEDYNKGVLTPAVIEKVISLCKHHHILTAVDPKRNNFFAYTGVDIFKPNLKEVKEAFNILSDEVSKAHLSDIHERLQSQLNHAISFITLSEKGVFYQMKNDLPEIISSHIRNVADVSGAGDTVIAVASVVYAATKDVNQMAAIANIAGGLVCEEVGTVAISKENLLMECKKLLN